ncbi:MAG TPA: hypothetical protein VF960_16140 [Chloroflexota bacterium]
MSPVKALTGIIWPFVLAVAVIAIGLRLLNGVPGYVAYLTAGPTPVPNVLDERLSFPSVEAAQKDLGVKVWVPFYFPSYLSWPPATVRGQREPVKVVSLLVLSTEREQALQVREVFWPGDDLPFGVPEPAQVAERRDVDIDGVAAKLLLGSGEGGTVVNQLRWRSGGVHFILTSVMPPEELLRMAGSMN